MEVHPSFLSKIWKFASHFLSFYGSLYIFATEKQIIMETQALLGILSDQREEFKTRDTAGFCLREEENLLSINSKLAQVVIGVRRCGKSTLCEQFIRHHKIACAYVNFDDERLAFMKTEDLNRLIEAIYVLYGDVHTFFFDEIQNIAAWPLFINRLLREQKHIFLTGSNAKLLSNELMTHLTGRHNKVELYPFSFKEYCQMKRVDLESLSTKAKAARKAALHSYLTEGGFPELINETNKKGYMNGLLDAIIKKDIAQRFKIRHIDTLHRMAGYLADNFAQEFTAKNIGKLFEISNHTAENYYSYLKEAFLLVGIPKFSYKAKERIRGEKVYVIDPAFVSERSGTFSLANLGWRLENAVCIELLRRSHPLYYEVFYYKQSNWEVDFVIADRGQVTQLIQVSYDISNPKTKEREIRGLFNAAKMFHCSNLLLLTYENHLDITQDGINIVVKDVSEWLCEK